MKHRLVFGVVRSSAAAVFAGKDLPGRPWLVFRGAWPRSAARRATPCFSGPDADRDGNVYFSDAPDCPRQFGPDGALLKRQGPGTRGI